jgi:YegS/Rv2252/BmrU family lipid kinase
MHPKTKITFIINPIAGTRQKEFIRQSISQRFSEDAAEVIYTAYPGHAFEIASEKVKEGCRAVVAVGGDGTVNEVASALVHSGCRLGIIPVGSGNGLARHLRIPMHVPDALAVIENHKEQEIDAGAVNGRYFFCTCGTGFDASVGKKFASDSRRGMLSYVRAIIHQYITYSPKAYILKTSHTRIKLRAFLVTFANSGQYGNNAYIAPNAVIDDGLLDLCILSPFPKTSTITLGLRLFFKNIDQSPYLEVMRVKKASLKRKGGKKILIHLDGEPVKMEGKLKFRVVPGGLKVMVPLRRRRNNLLNQPINLIPSRLQR